MNSEITMPKYFKIFDCRHQLRRQKDVVVPGARIAIGSNTGDLVVDASPGSRHCTKVCEVEPITLFDQVWKLFSIAIKITHNHDMSPIVGV